MHSVSQWGLFGVGVGWGVAEGDTVFPDSGLVDGGGMGRRLGPHCFNQAAQCEEKTNTGLCGEAGQDGSESATHLPVSAASGGEHNIPVRE